jgi:type 1 fimbria pilin
MKNLRRLALVSSIAALGAVAFNPTAQAGTADVTFSGNIPFTCSFSSTTSGGLVSNGGWVEATGNSVSGFDKGTAGSTTLRCNGSAMVSPSAPLRVSAPGSFDDSDKQAIIYIADNDDGNRIVSTYSGNAPWQNYANNGAAIPIPANISRVLKVGMTAGENNGSVVAGDYNYKVIVTATAN